MSLPIQPGDMLLGKYRVERVLGQGGMGVVVAARHVELGELFAIKFLLPAALAQPDAIERFLREARASARLKGEHVVKVQDVGRLPDGMPYMVMEYLAGSDLRDLVRQHGALPPADAIHYVLQACEALAEAHSLGIVHRDLKPANMFLIRRPNGAPCIKVLDFGISKQTEPESAEQHALTRTGMVLGSPIYMSPEQMTRTKEADPRGDIWSMGVVLYQLLTGTVPFLADVLTELVGKVLQEEPLPPSRHRPGIPPAVDAVVLTCLQKRREQRYQTVDQLMAALRTALAATTFGPGPGPAAGIPFVPQAAGPGAPRPAMPSQPELVGGTVALPLGLGSATGPTTGAVTGPGAQTGGPWGTTGTGSRPASEPKGVGVLIGATALLFVLLGGGALAVWRTNGDPGTTAPAAAPGPSPPTTGAESTGATSDTASPALTVAPATPGSETPPLPIEMPSSPPVTTVGGGPAGKPAASATPTTTAPTAKPTAAPTAKPTAAPTTKPTGALLGRD
jgi:hypothetical protein